MTVAAQEAQNHSQNWTHIAPEVYITFLTTESLFPTKMGSLYFLVLFFTVCLNWNKCKNKVSVDCVFRQVRNFVLNIRLDDVQYNKTDWGLQNLLNTLLDCPQKLSRQ